MVDLEFIFQAWDVLVLNARQGDGNGVLLAIYASFDFHRTPYPL